MPATSAKNAALSSPTGNAASDLLQQQLANETEEQRKRRLALEQQRRMTGSGSVANVLLGNPGGMNS